VAAVAAADARKEAAMKRRPKALLGVMRIPRLS
jgi:hypothetical protein